MAEFKAAAAASFSIDDLEQLSADGEETPDLLIIESGNEKFRDSSDAEIDDKIRTYERHLQDTKLLLKNKGKLQQHLEDLRSEQKFRMNRQSRLVWLFFQCHIVPSRNMFFFGFVLGCFFDYSIVLY